MDDMNTYGLILESVNEIKDIVTEGEGGQEDMEEKSTLALILDSVNEIKEALGGGGSGGAKHGIESVEFSPSINFIVGPDDSFPVYWEDLTEEERSGGLNINLTANSIEEAYMYNITITPTENMFVWAEGDSGDEQSSTRAGEPVTVSATSYNLGDGTYALSFDTQVVDDEDNATMVFSATVTAVSSGK